MLEHAASVLKALGEPTRLKILKFLSIQELCICELTAILDMSQPRVSQHIKVLKRAGLLKERKDGQKSYFTLNTTELTGPFIAAFGAFMQLGLDKIPELAQEKLRLLELDSNEDVQACKNGCMAAAVEIKGIM